MGPVLDTSRKRIKKEVHHSPTCLVISKVSKSFSTCSVSIGPATHFRLCVIEAITVENPHFDEKDQQPNQTKFT